MKLIADKRGIKVINIPKQENRANNMLDAVIQLATEAPIVMKGDTMVIEFDTVKGNTK